MAGSLPKQAVGPIASGVPIARKTEIPGRGSPLPQGISNAGHGSRHRRTMKAFYPCCGCFLHEKKMKKSPLLNPMIPGRRRLGNCGSIDEDTAADTGEVSTETDTAEDDRDEECTPWDLVVLVGGGEKSNFSLPFPSDQQH